MGTSKEKGIYAPDSVWLVFPVLLDWLLDSVVEESADYEATCLASSNVLNTLNDQIACNAVKIERFVARNPMTIFYRRGLHSRR